MATRILQPQTVIELPTVSAPMQRRPGTAHLLLAAGDRGLLVVDPWQGIVDQVAWPEEYTAREVTSWHLAPDGVRIFTIAVTDRQAAILWLDGASPARVLTAPPFADTVDLASYWATDMLVLSRPGIVPFVTLEVTAPILTYVEQRSIAIRQQCPSWRWALGQVPTYARIVRVEADRAQLLYVDASTQPVMLGVVNWATRTRWSVAALGMPVPQMVATTTQEVVAGHAAELQVLTAHQEVVAVAAPPPDSRLVSVETVPAVQDTPAALVMLATSVAETQSQLLVYAFPE